MWFLQLVDPNLRSTRWDEYYAFYRVTTITTEQFLVAVRTEKNGRMTDWVCSCDEWLEKQKPYCRHIVELMYELKKPARIPTLEPTKVNQDVFKHAQDALKQITRALSRYPLDDINLIDLSD